MRKTARRNEFHLSVQWRRVEENRRSSQNHHPLVVSVLLHFDSDFSWLCILFHPPYGHFRGLYVFGQFTDFL